MTTDNQRPYDVILYGATSFVGKITAKYLANFIKNKKINVAIAGRNQNKLDSIFNELDNPDVGMIIANSDDPASLDAMASQTRAIISTVGPYNYYGEPMIKACVENGTDYVDLCGEMTFVREMINKYEDMAKQTGARIVSTCGFDSLPSDLGVHYLQKNAIATFGEPCKNVSLKVKAAKGGMSGGTLASMVAMMSLASDDPTVKAQFMDPYVLVDEPHKPTTTQVLHTNAKFDTTHKRWQTPFIMDPTNSRVVHRSNYLSDFAYSKDFKYEELMWLPNNVKGKVMAKGIAKTLGIFEKAVDNKTWRKVLRDHLLPKPGTGPSVKAQESGYFDFRFYGYADDDARKNDEVKMVAKVTGQKDPGYGATGMMLSQACLCLALDVSKDDVGGGFWSPAFAMGDKLITRLTNHAMMTFDIIEG